MRDMTIFMGEDWHWEVWGKTMYSVRTGKSAWAEMHLRRVWLLQENSEALGIFNKDDQLVRALN